MSQYEKLAKNIIDNIGGKENVKGFIHCVTRLRFTLADVGLANDEMVKNIDGVISLVKSGGQYQIVIGNHVADVYDEVCHQLDMNNSDLSENNEKKKIGEMILDIVQNVFTPILPILCASGLIKGLNVLAATLGLYASDSSFYTLFNSMGDTLFYFFPMFLGYTSANKFGLKPFVGMGIGAMLCYPAINGVDMNFFGYEMSVTYTSTVLPVIVLCAFAAPLEKLFDKKLPSAVKSFLSPMFTLLIVVSLGYVVIGPAVNSVAVFISDILQGLYAFSPVLSGFVVAALWSILVVFGVHGPFMMLLVMNIINGTPDGLYAVVSVQSFAVTGTIFGIWLKTKDTKLKSVSLGSWITGIFGVTEPAIYGILLPRIKYLVITCISAGFAGAYLALMGIKAYQMAGMGIFRIPAFFEPGNVTSSTIHVVVGYAIAMVISGVTTYVLFKDDKKVQLTNEEFIKVYSPLIGRSIPIEEVEDEVFASKDIGDGIAVIPETGEVYAPFDGVVMTLFPTKHAIGFQSKDGCEVLVHIGFDTVNLNGEYFKSFVKQGDKVIRGQKVMKFHIEKLKEMGYCLQTPVVITNMATYSEIEKKENIDVDTDTYVVKCIK